MAWNGPAIQELRNASSADKPDWWVNPVSYSAADVSAVITKAEFADWEKTFQPLELGMLQQDSRNNPAVLSEAVSNAGTAANNTFNTLDAVRDRQLKATGAPQSVASQNTTRRLSSLSRAAAISGAENRARQQVRGQNEMITYGTAPNPQMGGA